MIADNHHQNGGFANSGQRRSRGFDICNHRLLGSAIQLRTTAANAAASFFDCSVICLVSTSVFLVVTGGSLSALSASNSCCLFKLSRSAICDSICLLIS